MEHERSGRTRWWHAAGAFLRWLCAREHLPASAAASTRRGQTPREGVRWLLAAEHLPPAGASAEADARTRFWRWLSGREHLPPVPTTPSARGSREPFLAWLFGPERLPSGDQEPSARGVAFFAWLFAREPIPAPREPDGPVTERDDGSE